MEGADLHRWFSGGVRQGGEGERRRKLQEGGGGYRKLAETGWLGSDSPIP